MLRLLPVLLLLGGLPALRAADSASLSGTVLGDSNAPLHRAEIIVHPVLARDNTWAAAATDSSGRFHLDNLPPGRYSIMANRDGYLPNRLEAPIDLHPGEQRANLLIHLSRPGVLSGVVLDAEGEPASGAYIRLLRKGFVRNHPAMVSGEGQMCDDRGQFRFYGLQPGLYGLAAAASGPMGIPSSDPLGYIPTFYPGVPAEDQAQLIAVKSGQEVSSLTLRVIQREMAVLDGQLSYPAEPPEGAQPQIVIHRIVADRSGEAMAAGMDPEHRFKFERLIPGPYDLQASIEVNGRLYAARQRVDLAPGEHAQVSVPLLPAIDLAGTLTLEGIPAASLAGHQVQLISGDQDGQRQPAAAPVKPDGSFILHNVPPGIWDINAAPVPNGGYIKAMTLGSLDVLRKDMPIGPSTTDSLKIVISANGGSVHGAVDANGRGGFVLLAPEGADRDVLSFYQLVRLDGRGQFDFHGITPGQYTLYAFTALPNGQAWTDPAFLDAYRAQGKSIAVHDGERLQAGTLPLIPLGTNP